MAGNSVLLSPHNDDEVLWSSFQICQQNPYVIVCLRSQIQEDRDTGNTATMREEETNLALSELEVTAWEQWPFLDSRPNWTQIESEIIALAEEYEHCIAPLPEDDGHAHHNWIGSLALNAFGVERVTQYTTYTRSGGRSTGREVVPEPWMIASKLRALACYQSQIEYKETRPHFLDGIREWVA